MDFETDLFPQDEDRIMDHLEHAGDLIPQFLEGKILYIHSKKSLFFSFSAGIQSVVNGPVSWPPDGNPLLGPICDDKVKNYWAACGFSYGIAHGRLKFFF